MSATLSRRAQQAAFLLLGVAAVYAALIPLATGGEAVAPDLLFCLTVAWLVRAPDAVPVLLVVALGLFADLMLSRPVGLGALALLLVAEAVRANRGLVRGTPFPVEWLFAVLAFAAALVAMRLVLRLAFLDPPGQAASVRAVVATAFAYPIVAAGLAFGLGLRSRSGR